MDIYRKSVKELDKEFDALIESDIEDDKFVDAMVEKIIHIYEKNLGNVGYEEPQSFDVELSLDKDGLWGMDDDTFYEMDGTIIDYSE